MSEREDATIEEILSWVTSVIGPMDGVNQTHGTLTLVRNMIGQVAIWEHLSTPQASLVFAEDQGRLLLWQGGSWVEELATYAAATRHAGEEGA